MDEFQTRGLKQTAYASALRFVINPCTSRSRKRRETRGNEKRSKSHIVETLPSTKQDFVFSRVAPLIITFRHSAYGADTFTCALDTTCRPQATDNDDNDDDADTSQKAVDPGSTPPGGGIQMLIGRRHAH